MGVAKAAPPAVVIRSHRGGSRPRARRPARTNPPPSSSWRAATCGRRSRAPGGLQRLGSKVQKIKVQKIKVQKIKVQDRKDMARSIWKGPFVDGYLLKKAEASRSSGRHEMIRIWSRRSTIL